MNLRELQQKSSGKTKVEDNNVLAFLNQDIKLGSDKIKDQDKESTYLQLHMLVSSGVDIRRSFELLETEQSNKKVKEKLGALKNNLIQGKSLADAMKEVKDFSAYEYYSVQIGEETGKITEVLEQLAKYYTRKIKQRRQLISALSYPMLILAASIGAVMFMLLFIIPMFDEVFSRFGSDLPGITKTIIGISKGFSSNLPLMIVAIIGIALSMRLFKDKKWMVRFREELLMRAPIFGKITMSIYMARFCSSMALLVRSKVPLDQALGMVGQMISLSALSQPLTQVKDQIIKGSTFWSTLSQHKIFDRKMVALIQVGEEVNQLEVFFEKLADEYSSETEHRTALLSSMLEPLMIVFLGLVVGFILIAMYLPMFKLSTSIGM